MYKDIVIKELTLSNKSDCDYWIDFIKDAKEKLKDDGE